MLRASGSSERVTYSLLDYLREKKALNSQANYLCDSTPHCEFHLAPDGEIITVGPKKGSVVLGKQDCVLRDLSAGAQRPPAKEFNQKVCFKHFIRITGQR